MEKVIKTNKAQKPMLKAEAQEDVFSELFTSRFLKGLVLVMIILFNMVILRNGFILVSPESRFSGDPGLDALLYGCSIAVLMVIVLFHEEQWDNAFCPGAFVLYSNTLVMVLYLDWFGWLTGQGFRLWLMGGLLCLLPVLGLFVMVVMLKK